VTDTIEAWLEQLTGGMRSTLQSRLSLPLTLLLVLTSPPLLLMLLLLPGD
jgi:hypothetical protein